MTSRHLLESKSLRALKEKSKLQETIALNAWIWTLSRSVTGNEWFHNVLFEFIGVVEDVMINPKYLCDSTCVVNIRN
jgi:hypothetical protein